MSDTVAIPHGLPLDRTDGPFRPPAGLGRLRDTRPLSRMTYFPDGHEGWLVTGHAHAREVLADTRFSSVVAGTATRSPIDIPGLDEHEPQPSRPGFFIRMDPPDHTRLRRMLTGVFTVKRMKQLEPRVDRIVTDHLDAMAAGPRPVDLVEAFALPVPSLVICELLGVPYADRDRFQRDSARLLSLDRTTEERNTALASIGALLSRLVKDKRSAPTDDLLSELAARDDLTDAELEGIATLLLIAGHETTANMLGLGTFALLQHRDQWEALRTDPSLVDGAVEELLRWLSIVHIGPTRIASEDIDFHGHRIAAGELVTVSVPAANHDAAKFEDPATLDVRRKANGHVAFGHGVHQCLGQQLARIEMRIGYRRLVERFGDLRLAIPADRVRMRTDMAIYGVHELPVTWDQEETA